MILKLITALFLFSVGLIIPLFTMAHSLQEPARTQESISSDNVDPSYYKYMEEIKEEILSRYYIEGAQLSYINRNYPNENEQRLSFSSFAEKGHWISEGSGIVASKRHSVAQHFGNSGSSYAVQQLTIALQNRDSIERPFRINRNEKDGPIIFWSSWSHGGVACFAYATSGTIEVERLPFPSNVAPERRKFYEGNPYVQTLSVRLNISFDKVLDEVEAVLLKEARPECQPFSVRETLEFYWRPLNSVINDYQ